jgi:valyl-tRNA synthetase
MEHITYRIDTPPPTISGNLHIGHIFSYTQADIIAEYHRYLGKDLLYPFCFDNNGIPTAKLASKHGIWKPAEILAFSQEKGKEYKQAFEESGIAFSEHSYHTGSEKAIQLAHEAFEILKQKGIAYKAEAEHLYCTTTHTSISQSELDDQGKIERTGLFPEIRKGIGWFIRTTDHIGEIQEMGNLIDWKPMKHKQRFDDWCKELNRDWSISREREFGIPISGETGMVFDTWFISSLCPQLAYGSIQCPIFDLRYQSHDIIRTWAFYTIAMSYFLLGQIPWKTIMITGHILDGKGDKFAKSQGNATNASKFLEEYGKNGIRHWASSYTTGNDAKIDTNHMKMGFRMTNKLLNAKKFLEMRPDDQGEQEELWKEWLMKKTEILSHLENFELDKSMSCLYTYFWNTFCDKHIETCKKEPIAKTLRKIATDIDPIFWIFYRH